MHFNAVGAFCTLRRTQDSGGQVNRPFLAVEYGCHVVDENMEKSPVTGYN
jgi:hypothetical protein